MNANAALSMPLDADLETASTLVGEDIDQRCEQRLAQDYPILPEDDYLEFLRQEVEKAQADIAAGRWKPHEQLEAERAIWRAQLKEKHGMSA